MKQNMHKIIVTLWLIEGGLLFAWGIVELWKIYRISGASNGAFGATLISQAFSTVIIVCAVNEIRNRRFANQLLVGTYALTLLYAVLYTLLGGFEDNRFVYSACVATFTLTALAGISIERTRGVRTEQYAPGKPVERVR
jgi:hypothetical protein